MQHLSNGSNRFKADALVENPLFKPIFFQLDVIYNYVAIGIFLFKNKIMIITN
jgi:hypothetical protein